MATNVSSSSSSSGGIGFCGALTILFIALKLLGYIDWSWWWVLAPLWFGAAIALVLVGLVVGGAWVAVLIDDHRDRRRIEQRKRRGF